MKNKTLTHKPPICSCGARLTPKNRHYIGRQVFPHVTIFLVVCLKCGSSRSIGKIVKKRVAA